MKVNFELKENHILYTEGRLIDLQNNFDYVGHDYFKSDKKLLLKFKRTTGEWIDDDEINSLVLIHKGVSFLNIIEKAENSSDFDDCTIDDITFFPSASRDINNCTCKQTKPKEGDDILYFLENEQLIRVHCKEIEIIMN